MGYHFKLEALRRYRQFQEDELQRELADALHSKEEAISILANFETQLAQTEKEMYRQQTDSTNAAKLIIFPRFMQRITENISEQHYRIEKIDKQCKMLREALLEAVKKRKTLEKLEEKEFQSYLADLSSEEQKFINEIAINQFNLKLG